MKPTLPTPVPDKFKWFIVGAYQAGASESEIASMTSLPRFVIRNSVSSFKKTGNPTITIRRKRKRKKRSTKKKRFRYDSLADTKGDYSESSSDESYGTSDYVDKKTDTEIQGIKKFSKMVYNDRSPSIKLEGKPTATDAINYILSKSRKHKEKSLSSRQEASKQHQVYQNQSQLNDTINDNNDNDSTSPDSQSTVPTMAMQTLTVELQQTNPYIMDNTLSTPSPSTPSPSPFSSFITDNHFDYNNKPTHNTNLWSRNDDKILLQHVLTRMGSWNELDQLFDGRHSETDCKERWNILQHYLFKQLNKNGTIGW